MKIEWNSRYIPTPLTKQLVLPSVEEPCFAYISFSTAIESSLEHSNLTLTDDDYCLELEAGISPVLKTSHTESYSINLYASEFITESGRVKVGQFQAVAIKASKVKLKFPDYTGFLIRDSNNKPVYGDIDPQELELEIEDGWIAITNLDSKVLNVEVEIL